MGYVALGELVLVAVLAGAWRAKKAALVEAVAAISLLKAALIDASAKAFRYENLLAAVTAERDAARKELDAHATPDSTRNDLNRLLSR